MSHTCDVCGETFETLTRLRLHDCSGPDLEDSDQVRAVAEQLEEGLDRGDVVTTLPDGGLSPETVDRLEEHEGFLTVFVPMNNPGESTTERLAILVEGNGYVVEYFPWKGWIVARAASTVGMTDDEALDALMEQLQDWQSRVTELSLDYAGGDDNVPEQLRRELNL